jgi:hypothetical protein
VTACPENNSTLQSGTASSMAIPKIDAAHSRQDNVAEKQLRRDRAGKIESAFRVVGWHSSETPAREDRSKRIRDHALIVYDKDHWARRMRFDS